MDEMQQVSVYALCLWFLYVCVFVCRPMCSAEVHVLLSLFQARDASADHYFLQVTVGV